MRAISLWQPWASAMAVGLKMNETRSWSTNYRGPVAIHAAIRWTREEQSYYIHHPDYSLLPAMVPLGKIVAIGNLVMCTPVENVIPTERERSWGNYSEGRYAWIFDDVRALPEPIPFKGAQGFFNVPDQLVTALQAARGKP